jgi:DNA-binding phage protein
MMGKSHEEFMIERFRANPEYAVTLLNSILEDGDDQGELRIFLRQMTAAFGIDSDVAKNASDIGNLIETMRAMGLRLSVAPVPVRRKRHAKQDEPKRDKRVRRTPVLAADE